MDLQVHPPIMSRCLSYPGQSSGPDHSNEMLWSSLAVEYRPEWRRVILVEKASGKVIVPLHFGAIAPAFFPPLYRFLSTFGPCFAPDLPLLDLLEGGVPVDARAVPRAYPRITHGPVTLLRKTWCVPADALPRVDRMRAFERFRALRSWAYELGLPRRVFVTPMLSTEVLQRGPANHWSRRLRKPFFVDWDSDCCHELFFRFVKGATGTIAISEMLPRYDLGPNGRDSAPRQVSETMLDLYWI